MKQRRCDRADRRVMVAWLVCILAFVVVINPIFLNVDAAKGG